MMLESCRASDLVSERTVKASHDGEFLRMSKTLDVGTDGTLVSNIQAGGISVAGTNALHPTDNGWFLFLPGDPNSGIGYQDADFRFATPPSGLIPNYLTFVNVGTGITPGSSFQFSFDSFAPPGTTLAYAMGNTTSAA